MEIKKVQHSDIDPIRELQPQGWPDIGEAFIKYLEDDFCTPIKVVVDSSIVGIGAVVYYGDTAWIAHIIVKESYRSKGIGYKIVNHLIAHIKDKNIDNLLLVATELGRPLYQKFGFKTISDFWYLERETEWNSETEISDNIVPYNSNFYERVIELDRNIVGESREALLKQYLHKAVVCLEQGKVCGVYIPDFGEGLIIANTTKAGIELMKFKYSKVGKAVIPEENKSGIDFLINNGFKLLNHKGYKMVLGKGINWKPKCYFSRIGGNYG